MAKTGRSASQTGDIINIIADLEQGDRIGWRTKFGSVKAEVVEAMVQKQRGPAGTKIMLKAVTNSGARHLLVGRIAHEEVWHGRGKGMMFEYKYLVEVKNPGAGEVKELEVL